MKVQNMMVPYVTRRTNALYDEISATSRSFVTCSCENCRLETICYVLNLIPPKYVVSGRGVTHTSLSLNGQAKADIDSTIIAGMRAINVAKRPYHWSSTKFFSTT